MANAGIRSWAFVALIVTAVWILMAAGAEAGARASGVATHSPPAERVICWIADGQGMHPTADLEAFLVDRLGATGEREVIDPGVAHSILRVLGLQHSSTFSTAATHHLAVAADARWVLWVKIVSRDIQSKKLLGVPYLFNHRRLDARVFFDVRLYDARLCELLGSKRLRLSDRGEGTWQVTEDERLDPAYNNDPVEIHQRYRRLDWRAAALISGYCADVFRSPRFALLEKNAAHDPARDSDQRSPVVSPAVRTAGPPD